jgi:hypothetical protein
MTKEVERMLQMNQLMSESAGMVVEEDSTSVREPSLLKRRNSAREEEKEWEEEEEKEREANGGIRFIRQSSAQSCEATESPLVANQLHIRRSTHLRDTNSRSGGMRPLANFVEKIDNSNNGRDSASKTEFG